MGGDASIEKAKKKRVLGERVSESQIKRVDRQRRATRDKKVPSNCWESGSKRGLAKGWE